MKSIKKKYKKNIPLFAREGVFLQGGIKTDPMGYWNPNNIGNPVIIPSNEITMQGVNQPLLGISDTGDIKKMMPGKKYKFGGSRVLEIPLFQRGGNFSKWYNQQIKTGQPGQTVDYNGRKILLDPRDFKNIKSSETTTPSQTIAAPETIPQTIRNENINTSLNSTDIDFRSPIYNEATLSKVFSKIFDSCDGEEGCLNKAIKGFDAVIPKNFNLKSLRDLWEGMGIQSFKQGDESNFSEKAKENLRKIPYLNIDNPSEKGYNSLDSWEVAKVLQDNGADILFKPSNERKSINLNKNNPNYLQELEYIKSLNIPIGSFIGFSRPDLKNEYNQNSLSNQNNLGNPSHSTILIGWDEKGNPILSDMGKAVNLNDESFLRTWDDIVSIAAPKEYQGKDFNYFNNLRNENTISPNKKYQVDDNIKKEIGWNESAMNSFIGGLENKRESIIKRLNLPEEKYDELAKRLIAITGKESKFGSSLKYDLENKFGGDDNSLGLSQLKWKNIKDDEQLRELSYEFGLRGPDDLRDPEKSAIASMLYSWKQDAYAQNNFKRGIEPSHRLYSKNTEYFKNYFRDPNWEENKLKRDVLRNIVSDETFKMPRKLPFESEEKYADRVNNKFKKDEIYGPANIKFERLLERKKNEKDPDVYNYYVVKPTEGNSPNLTDDQKFFANWQGGRALASGDVQLNQEGLPKNEYVRDANRIYQNIKKRGGFILPKAQAGVSGFEEFNINPSSFQSAFPTTQQSLPIIPLQQGIQTESEEGKTPDNTNYTLRDLKSTQKDNYVNPALFSFGKAALSALGTRMENRRKFDSVQEKLFDPFQVLPNVTTNNEFLNKGNKIFQDGGEFEDSDFNFLFNEDENNFEDNYELDNFEVQQPEQEEEISQDIITLDDEDESSITSTIPSIPTTPTPFTPVVPPIRNSEESSFAGIFRNEGAKTGQPTNLKSSAIGRGQMIKGTRMSMYKKLGITDFNWAEKEFKTNPDFEMQVLNAYKEELDKRIPSNIQGKQREYMIAKGWYTGDPFYPDNKVPGRSAGNRLTAGEYARRAIK
jgi:hypothetical protein